MYDYPKSSLIEHILLFSWAYISDTKSSIEFECSFHNGKSRSAHDQEQIIAKETDLHY
jgi:hypothetical protein